MYFESKSVLVKTNFNHETPSLVKLYEVKPYNIPTSDLVISLFPIGFVIGWTGLFLMLSKLRTAAIDQMIVTTNSLQKVRCKNCQFFSNNRYLKCAIQPSIVLTKEAENCADYCPINEK